MIRAIPVPVGTSGLLLAALFSAVPPTTAQPAIVVDSRILLRVEVLEIHGDDTTSLGSSPIEISPDEGGVLDRPVPWPEGDPAVRLRLRATGSPAADGEHRIGLEARLVFPDGREVRSSRVLHLSEGGSGLQEVYSEDAGRLVLALTAETVTRPMVRPAPSSTTTVRFRLGVERVEGEQATELETNDLQTLVGEGIGYAFRRGEGVATEAVELVLTPVRIEGEIIEVEAEVSGTLPGTDRPLVLSRRERIVASRNATSSITVTAGAPPSGYRFRITTDY